MKNETKNAFSLLNFKQIKRRQNAGVKVHTFIDVNTAIPTFIRVTKGSAPDCHALDYITIEPGAFYVMDKAYVDFKRLNKIDEQKGFFIVRSKRNIKFERLYSKSSSRAKEIIADQIVNLVGGIGKKNYHNKIRKIIFYDCEKK